MVVGLDRRRPVVAPAQAARLAVVAGTALAERTQADTEFLAREIASVRLSMSDMLTGEVFDDRLDRLTEIVEQLSVQVARLQGEPTATDLDLATGQITDSR